MTCRVGLPAAVIAHVDTVGRGLTARRAARAWTRPSPPGIGSCPGEIAAVARAAGPAGQDRILRWLLTQESGERWAEMTVLAVVAPRLAGLVGRWATAGVAGADLADLEAGLVAECWEAIRAAMTTGPRPPRPGLALVDAAWQHTRTRRTRDRRRAARVVPVPPEGWPVMAGDGNDRPGELLATQAIGDALAAGTIGAGPARALWSTRVAGHSTTETAQAMATTPGVVRVLRARAACTLAARPAA